VSVCDCTLFVSGIVAAGNYEIYRHPLTSAQDIGVWNKDEPLREKEPWTYVRRRVHLDSEMTRSGVKKLLSFQLLSV